MKQNVGQVCRVILDMLKRFPYLPASMYYTMNRYLLLAAAAASVAVTGPLPDLQWQSNNNRLFDFVAESPSALTQDVRGLNFLVLDKPWMIAGSPNVMPFTNDDQNYMDPENPHFNNIPDLPTLDNTSPEPPPTLSGTPTDTWILKSFECKAQASVCCSEENRLGPEFINSPSSTKSCAASMFLPIPSVTFPNRDVAYVVRTTMG